ncbi:MAG: single-stranded DNA-binding protein [Endomicrobium sp.]|jgi:single-strand DNA-binding protein|nr:single-stranded DNA-binding protein [Endomicrobium sp.]
MINNNKKTKILRFPEVNSVVLLGRLTKDSDLKRTNLGQAVCSFVIALSRRIKDSNNNSWKDSNPVFVPIIVWGQRAEKLFDKLKKGVAVYIQGKLKTNKWISDNGKINSRLEVVASRVQYLSEINVDAEVEYRINDKQINTEEGNNVNNPIDEDDNNEEIPF